MFDAPVGEPALLLAIGLLVAGVLATAVPLVPGAALSLLGIIGYWWASGFAEPPGWFVLLATAVALVALALDALGGIISARISGAPRRTAVIAGLVGIALLLPTGPIGSVLGVVGTVFVLEIGRTDDVPASLRTAATTTVLLAASAATQVLLTASLLVGFLLVVLA